MNQTPNRNFAIVAAACFVGLVLLVLLVRQRPSRSAASNASPARAASAASAPEGKSVRETPAELLRAVFADLKKSSKAGPSKALLESLAANLRAAPPQEASVAISEFLKSGEDAPTGLDFKPGLGGALIEAPTWRVFLIDALARTDPPAAAGLAREVLREKKSPDEWAVCLRNIARVETGGDARAFLELKMKELLQHEPWQVNPSAGYLESFDVAVYLGGTTLVPPLAMLARKQDNQAVAYAAFLALDQMTLRDAGAMLGFVEARPELLAGRELTRANFFSRVDVRENGQRMLVERYLANPGLGAAELERFAGLFPNANFTVSQNLLTKPAVPDHAALVARDFASLQVVDEWLADARLATARASLLKTRERLAGFVAQARTN